MSTMITRICDAPQKRTNVHPILYLKPDNSKTNDLQIVYYKTEENTRTLDTSATKARRAITKEAGQFRQAKE